MNSPHNTSIDAHIEREKHAPFKNPFQDMQFAFEKKPGSQDYQSLHHDEHLPTSVPHSLDELAHENEKPLDNVHSEASEQIRNLKKSLKEMKYQWYKIWLHIMISLSAFSVIFIVTTYTWGSSMFFGVLMLVNIAQCSLEIIAINTKSIQKANIAFPMMNIYAAVLVILLLLSSYDQMSYQYIMNRFGFPPFVLAFLFHLITLLYAMPVDNVLEQIYNLQQKELKEKASLQACLKV